jgi:hypothetical protein
VPTRIDLRQVLQVEPTVQRRHGSRSKNGKWMRSTWKCRRSNWCRRK